MTKFIQLFSFEDEEKGGAFVLRRQRRFLKPME
jgi:hypothetical protein